MELVIREIRQSELPFLKNNALPGYLCAKGSPKLPMNIIEQPKVAKYIENFSRVGDLCLVVKSFNT